jgi:Concanavalin A-like lectin/glucanases superfamily
VALLRSHGGIEAASPDLTGYPEQDMRPCWAFWNSSRYLIVAADPSLSTPGKFTAELWVYAWGLPSGKVALIDRDWQKPGPYRIVLDPSGLLEVSAAGMTWMKIAPGPHNDPLPLNQWVHLALVCDGKTTRVYANGRKVAEYDCYGKVEGSVNRLHIGRPIDERAVFPGMVREVRISKSVRYTADFTPAWRFEPDADTVLLLHCDEGQGGQHQGLLRPPQRCLLQHVGLVVAAAVAGEPGVSPEQEEHPAGSQIACPETPYWRRHYVPVLAGSRAAGLL